MPKHRKVRVDAIVEITDHERLAANEVCTYPASDEQYLIPGRQNAALLSFAECCGGEVRGELSLTASYEGDGDISVEGKAKLFEGDSCATASLEDSRKVQYTIPKDKTLRTKIRLFNSGAFGGGGDRVKMDLTFSNTEEDFPKETVRLSHNRHELSIADDNNEVESDSTLPSSTGKTLSILQTSSATRTATSWINYPVHIVSALIDNLLNTATQYARQSVAECPSYFPKSSPDYWRNGGFHRPFWSRTTGDAMVSNTTSISWVPPLPMLKS